MKEKHYTLDNIKKRNASINMIIGEKSNGKTYACKLEILKQYFAGNGKGAYIRRTDEDFKRGRADRIFADMVKNKDGISEVEKLSKGQYNFIKFSVNGWYLGNKYVTIDKKGEYVEKIDYQSEPFCYAFSINNAEHTNGQSFLEITTIFFDEFTTKKTYLSEEFEQYNILLSNIIRNRDNVTIYMCGNTVDKHCLYFREMGLYNVLKMKQGDIDVYDFGTENGGKLIVAVEYCDTSIKAPKKSDKYFAFDNPTLKMIKKGEWDLNIYPHLKGRFDDSGIYYTFLLKFNEIYLKCHIYNYNDDIVLFFTPCKNPIITNDTLIFRNDDLIRKNDRRFLKNGGNGKIYRIIANCINYDKVFFATNECGDIFRKYMQTVR